MLPSRDLRCFLHLTLRISALCLKHPTDGAFLEYSLLSVALCAFRFFHFGCGCPELSSRRAATIFLGRLHQTTSSRSQLGVRAFERGVRGVQHLRCLRRTSPLNYAERLRWDLVALPCAVSESGQILRRGRLPPRGFLKDPHLAGNDD